MGNTTYEDYLKTDLWKTRRNRRLAFAHYRCERCNAKRDLQVHHKSYDRLGRETDEDLEVLCRDCHETHHRQEMQDTSHRVYLALASALLRDNPWSDVATLSVLIKERCIQLGMRDDAHQIDKAINILTGANRFRPTRTPKTVEEVAAVSYRPPTASEAREVLHRLGLDALVRRTPSAAPSKIDIYGPELREDSVDHDRY